MKYILTAGWDDGVADLTERLVRELATGKRVLWLLSGGSNIPSSVQIMDNISADLSKNLSVSLIDERYGEPGHSESNWAQLIQAGFDGKQARLLPILQPGASFEQTIETYNQLIEKAFDANDVIIAQLGIGPDGHVAGILPNSAATTAKTLVTGYEAPPLTRLTLTFPALRQITAAYAFAFGKPKQQALVSLQAKALPPEQQPAQILNELPEAYMYSDQVGEHV
jgi:6-phosphogluconolactonase